MPRPRRKGGGVKEGRKNVEKHTKSVRKTKFFLKKKIMCPETGQSESEKSGICIFFLLPMKEAKFTLGQF